MSETNAPGDFFDRDRFWTGIVQGWRRPLKDDPLDTYVRQRGLRFIIETVSRFSVEELTAIVADFWGRGLGGELYFRVEKLFDGLGEVAVPESLANFYLAVLEGVDFESLTVNPYDAAYALLTAPGMVTVEPDIPFTQFLGSSTTSSGGTAAASGTQDKAWSLRNMSVDQAWALVPPAGGRSHGEGVRIAHLDTGWTTHDDLDWVNFDLARSRDFIDPTGNASDPMTGGLGFHPGHGTRTGSVMMSRGGVMAAWPPGTSGPGEITGVATEATYVPVRCIRSVLVVFGGDIARGVWHATASSCDIISMSLGGRGVRALHRAIQHAVANDLIVLAAAGNNVRLVVWPAAYAETVAVAASNSSDLPWSGSSRGPQVDISAPGENVWNAEPLAAPSGTKESSGTSYSTAHLAGVAALWLAFFSKSALIKSSLTSGLRLQDLFRHQLSLSARVPPTWDTAKFGAGIVDVHALLTTPIPSSHQSPRSSTSPMWVGSLNRLLRRPGRRLTNQGRSRWSTAHFFENELSNLYLDHPDEAVKALLTIERDGPTNSPQAVNWLRRKLSMTLFDVLTRRTSASSFRDHKIGLYIQE